MKAVVIGYGSIGARHTRLLTGLGCTVAVVSCRDISYELSFSAIREALQEIEPEYVVIANKTNEHYSTLLELNGCGLRSTILVEKPLFNTSEILPASICTNIFVAYNLRFHPVLQRLRSILEREQVISCSVYVGQYLPEWRPGTDYRQGYSAHKAEGGGVLRDLSHEIDYLHWLFGDWERLTALGGKHSQLEIDSDDIYAVLAKFNRCSVVMLQMNYLERVPRREIIVNTQTQTIKADLIQNFIEVNGCKEVFTVERDYTYLEQHRALLFNCRKHLCTLAEGMSVVKTIEAIETASNFGGWVENE